MGFKRNLDHNLPFLSFFLLCHGNSVLLTLAVNFQTGLGVQRERSCGCTSSAMVRRKRIGMV